VSDIVLKTSHQVKVLKSSRQVEVQESVDKTAKQLFPPNLTPSV